MEINVLNEVKSYVVDVNESSIFASPEFHSQPKYMVYMK